MQHILVPNKGLKAKAEIDIRKESPTAVPIDGALNLESSCIMLFTKEQSHMINHLAVWPSE